MSTPLAKRIKTLIRTNGPITVAEYFALCLSDPKDGYYQTKQPFGSTGDFTTAPEISQLFGEMVGVFLLHAWQQHQMPSNVRLVEIGPGRGTMMLDMLRVISQLAPSLFETMSIHLVETSEALSKVQAQTLNRHQDRITWHTTLDDVPSGFSLIAANELFDAVPIHQFVRNSRGFVERVVGLNDDGELIFIEGSGGIDHSVLPKGAANEPLGSIYEHSPARDSIMQMISERLKQDGGTSAIIDYGHISSGYGDTLQALRKHVFDPVLAHPGEADLTSHVDFETLTEVAEACGIHVNGCIPQGDFLYGLGLAQRAASLAQKATPEQQLAIGKAVKRLAGKNQDDMGDLFKVLSVSYPPVPLAPFKSAH